MNGEQSSWPPSAAGSCSYSEMLSVRELFDKVMLYVNRPLSRNAPYCWVELSREGNLPLFRRWRSSPKKSLNLKDEPTSWLFDIGILVLFAAYWFIENFNNLYRVSQDFRVLYNHSHFCIIADQSAIFFLPFFELHEAPKQSSGKLQLTVQSTILFIIF